jgi:hypothetical protein
MRQALWVLAGGLIAASLPAAGRSQTPQGLPGVLGRLAYTPFAPRSRARELAAYAATLRKRCTVTPSAPGCDKANSPNFESISKSLILTPPECDEAARKYRPVLGDCMTAGDCKANEPGSAAVAFDNACLASSLPWSSETRTRQADETPALFRKGGENAGVAGALNATVLIQFFDSGTWRHHCGGLLRPGNRIITARHCFTSHDAIEALKDGRAHVRVLGRPEQAYPLDRSAADISQGAPPAVESDRLTLAFQGPTPPMPAPNVVFRSVTGPTEALVVGYYPHWSKARAANAPDVPEWLQGIRWPGNRMCHAMYAVGACLRLLCQTVPGYSGTPIFDAAGRGGEPLRVLGIVSREDTNAGGRCGPQLPEATLATVITDTAGGVPK